jgi:hypothetical protein
VLQEIEAFRISRQLAREGGKSVRLTNRPPLSLGRFMLEAESTPGSKFDRKKNSNNSIGNRTRDLPASVSPHLYEVPTMRGAVPAFSVTQNDVALVRKGQVTRFLLLF